MPEDRIPPSQCRPKVVGSGTLARDPECLAYNRVQGFNDCQDALINSRAEEEARRGGMQMVLRMTHSLRVRNNGLEVSQGLKVPYVMVI